MAAKITSDPQAEEQLLSRIPKSPELLDTGEIMPSLFSVDSHRRLFEAWTAARLSGEKVCADVIRLFSPEDHALALRMEARPLGGASSKSLVEALETIRMRRQLATLCSQGYEKVMEAEDPHAELDRIQGEFLGMTREASRLTSYSPVDTCLRIAGEFENRVCNPGLIRGMRTGKPLLDKYIGGRRGGKLYVVGAGTSTGKTADMCNELHFAGQSGTHVHCATIEMDTDELTERIVAIEAKCSLEKGSCDNGGYNNYDLEKIMRAFATISRWSNIHWMSNPRIMVDEWAREVRAMKAKFDIKCAYLDHLQAVTLDRKQSSKVEAIGYVAQVCKEMARELDIPVVLYSQLKRLDNHYDPVKKKTTVPWPKIGDLKESGDIENYADVVELLHRDRENEPEIMWRIIAKQRSGDTYAKFKHDFNGRYFGITETYQS